MIRIVCVIAFLWGTYTISSQKCITDDFQFLEGEWIATDSLGDYRHNDIEIDCHSITESYKSDKFFSPQKYSYNYNDSIDQWILSYQTYCLPEKKWQGSLSNGNFYFNSETNNSKSFQIKFIPLYEDTILRVVSEYDSNNKITSKITNKLVRELPTICGFLMKFYFLRGKDLLEDYSKEALHHFIRDILKFWDGSNKIAIIGHCNVFVEEVNNYSLSLQRAQKVKEILLEYGFPEDELVCIGKGSSDLKYPECDEVSKCPDWKHEQNARVVFYFYE